MPHANNAVRAEKTLLEQDALFMSYENMYLCSVRLIKGYLILQGTLLSWKDNNDCCLCLRVYLL